MKRAVKLFTLVVSVFLFASALNAFADKSEGQRKNVELGMLLTLSGSFASAGEDCRKGIEAGLKISKASNTIDLDYADSKNEPSTAISEFRRLVTVKNNVAVYLHRSSIGMPLNPVSKKLRVPILGAVGHKDFSSGNEYAFQVWPRSDEEGQFVAEEFIKRGYKRAALLYTEDEWTGAVSNGFREKFAELEGDLVFNQSVLLAETDFRTLLLKIKQQSPDAIYLNLLLPQIGPVIKQARELGVEAEYFSNFYVSREDVLRSAGATALRGVKYVEMDTNLPALKKSLGIRPDVNPAGLTVASYVATALLGQAVSEIDGAVSSESMYSALLKQTHVRTPDHEYEIENRYVKFPLAIKEIGAQSENLLSKE